MQQMAMESAFNTVIIICYFVGCHPTKSEGEDYFLQRCTYGGGEGDELREDYLPCFRAIFGSQWLSS